MVLVVQPLILTQTPYYEDDDLDPPPRYTQKLSSAAIGAIIGASFGVIFMLVVSIISIYAYCCSNSKSTGSSSNGISGSGSLSSRSELRSTRSPLIGKKPAFKKLNKFQFLLGKYWLFSHAYKTDICLFPGGLT